MINSNHQPDLFLTTLLVPHLEPGQRRADWIMGIPFGSWRIVLETQSTWILVCRFDIQGACSWSILRVREVQLRSALSSPNASTFFVVRKNMGFKQSCASPKMSYTFQRRGKHSNLILSKPIGKQICHFSFWSSQKGKNCQYLQRKMSGWGFNLVNRNKSVSNSAMEDARVTFQPGLVRIN